MVSSASTTDDLPGAAVQPADDPTAGGRPRPELLPLIVRVAGLPADSLAPFGLADVDADRRFLEPIAALEARSRQAREQLVDALYAVVGGAPDEARKGLLKLKRDAYNGRPLAGAESSLEGVLGAGSQLLERLREIVEIDCRRQGLEAELVRLLERRQPEERRSLVESLADPELRRGMALASPSTVENLYRLERKPVDRWGKRERRLELSGIRFLSRAAVKTSPYSTLTRSALGVIAERAERGNSRGAELLGSGAHWARSCRLRLKRFLPEGDLALLTRCEAFVRDLSLASNDTLESLGDDRYQFLRPVLLAPKDGKLLSFSSIMLQAKLRHPLLARLADGSVSMPQPYEELLALIGDGAGVDRNSARRLLYQLVEAGILSFVLPWPASALQAEREILRRLEELDQGELDQDRTEEPGEEPALAAVRREYETLLQRLEQFSTGVEPVATLRSIDQCVEQTFQRAAEAAGIELAGARVRPEAGNYYEDVHLTCGPREESGEVPAAEVGAGPAWGACLRIEPATASAIHRALRPIHRLNHLLHRRHELLSTLGAFMATEWPGRTEVPLIEAFVAFQDHWRAFKKWRTRRRDRDFDLIFNPLELEVNRDLREMRRRVYGELVGAMVEHEDGSEGYCISPDALLEITEAIPAAYKPPCGPCAFLQPSDAGAREWVLNRLYEGTGRYSARFAAAMPGDMARRWNQAQQRRRPVLFDGQEAALLDLWTANFDTLNLHGIQTDYVLALPGNHFAGERSRLKRLSDLCVRFRPDIDAAPRIVDRSGQLLCPVYLGGTGIDFSPPIIEMMAHFGPGDLKTPGFPVPAEERPDGRSWQRLRSGPIILRRRHWQLETAEIHRRTRHLGLFEAMGSVNRWRFENGVPAQVFIIEKIAEDRFKPQYVDFTSPLFFAIFRRSLQDQARLSLSEALPSPDSLPEDRQGSSFNIEIQFEYANLGD